MVCPRLTVMDGSTWDGVMREKELSGCGEEEEEANGEDGRGCEEKSPSDTHADKEGEITHQQTADLAARRVGEVTSLVGTRARDRLARAVERRESQQVESRALPSLIASGRERVSALFAVSISWRQVLFRSLSLSRREEERKKKQKRTRAPSERGELASSAAADHRVRCDCQA